MRMTKLATTAQHASTRSASASRRDVIGAYFNEVHRHPVLPHDQQIAIAREFVATGRPELAARLVTTNLRLVVKMAKEFSHGRLPLEDLIQEGNLGLMHAVRKFDPEQGVKLSTYAAWWIRAYVIKASRRASRLVRIDTSHTHRSALPKLRREVARLEGMGITPTSELLAARLQLDESDVLDMSLRLAAREVSFDEPIGAEGKLTLLDGVAANDVAADESYAAHESEDLLNRKLREFAEQLQGRDAVIFDRRLLADEPATLRGLGSELGISRERVRQLESSLEKRLKKFLEHALPEEMLQAA